MAPAAAHETDLALPFVQTAVVGQPAEQVGPVGAGAGEEPPGAVGAAEPGSQEEATDERIAIAHRPEQQGRPWARLRVGSPQSSGSDRVDEEGDARGAPQRTGGDGEMVTGGGHGGLPRVEQSPIIAR